jgi:hypothetical protein
MGDEVTVTPEGVMDGEYTDCERYPNCRAGGPRDHAHGDRQARWHARQHRGQDLEEARGPGPGRRAAPTDAGPGVEKMAQTMPECMDEATEQAFDTFTGLVRGATSETVQFKAVASVLDRSTTAPTRQIHTHSTKDIERRDIRIIITPEMMHQFRMGDIDEEEFGDLIDVAPQPVRPVRDILAALEAA